MQFSWKIGEHFLDFRRTRVLEIKKLRREYGLIGTIAIDINIERMMHYLGKKTKQNQSNKTGGRSSGVRNAIHRIPSPFPRKMKEKRKCEAALSRGRLSRAGIKRRRLASLSVSSILLPATVEVHMNAAA